MVTGTIYVRAGDVRAGAVQEKFGLDASATEAAAPPAHAAGRRTDRLVAMSAPPARNTSPEHARSGPSPAGDGGPERDREDRPFVVGLTGGIGSGKSTVADLFAARGVTVVDTDAIAHELTAPGGEAIAAIRAAFGPSVIRADGALDRDAMRARAFDDAEARRRLEAILHPMIRDESLRRIRTATSAYVIHVVPLLVESGGRAGRYDRVLVVDCPVEVQIERVGKRSGLDRQRIESILATQASREARLQAADDVIENGGAPEGLERQVEVLHRRYAAAR